jgi:hypothetical protein
MWKPYIEEYWLPRWGHRSVVFNRSKPWQQEQVEARLWRRARLGREHTPAAIILGRRIRAQFIPLFEAFRDYKHGKQQELRDAERQIEVALADGLASHV